MPFFVIYANQRWLRLNDGNDDILLSHIVRTKRMDEPLVVVVVVMIYGLHCLWMNPNCAGTRAQVAYCCSH